MRSALGAALLLCSAPLWAAKPLPPAPRSYVHNEGVISPGAESALSQRLREVEQKTGRQLVVALFQGLEGESLEDYSNTLFREWKVGSKERNDGLLFALFMADRAWRVEVGYGLEGDLTDLEAGEIGRDAGVPFFKVSDYDHGVAAIVEALAARLEGTAPARRPRRALDEGRMAGLFLAGCALFVIMLLVFAAKHGGTGRSIGRRRHGRWTDSSDDWSSGSSSGWSSGGSSDFGGFSGGGGSSGGGGASGRW